MLLTRGNPSPMIKRTLFKVGDKTVLPLTPIRLRAGASPRRTVDRVRAYAGIVNNQDVGVGVNVRDEEKDDIVFAFSLAKGW